MTDAQLDRFAKDSVFSQKEILFFLWAYVVRDMSVRWLCLLSAEIEVEVYGRYWEHDDMVRPFFKGALPHGAAVATLYNETTYALVPHMFDLQSQRLIEAAACGAIPIVYDCRYRAEKPHWDDHCLWYRRQEELQDCLTKRTLKPPRHLCQGRTFTDFAQRIITEVESCG